MQMLLILFILLIFHRMLSLVSLIFRPIEELSFQALSHPSCLLVIEQLFPFVGLSPIAFLCSQIHQTGFCEQNWILCT